MSEDDERHVEMRQTSHFIGTPENPHSASLAEVIDECLAMPIVVGENYPSLHRRDSECPNGCCTQTIVADTANEHAYLIAVTPKGIFDLPLQIEIPEEIVKLEMIKLMASLN